MAWGAEHQRRCLVSGYNLVSKLSSEWIDVRDYVQHTQVLSSLGIKGPICMNSKACPIKSILTEDYLLK
ncbi:hypothetical protein Y1Q_0015169 [Alligator mississippiensis]|uniref:Uncharacterized protein n=1 Tax=Alligator mississippiensis TaxID=8496 RepID=A0A151P8U5_ALLMI|nr:hypothetical protein Y1Q_0015169 [Alligator mississippiensis]